MSPREVAKQMEEANERVASGDGPCLEEHDEKLVKQKALEREIEAERPCVFKSLSPVSQWQPD